MTNNRVCIREFLLKKIKEAHEAGAEATVFAAGLVIFPPGTGLGGLRM